MVGLTLGVPTVVPRSVQAAEEAAAAPDLTEVKALYEEGKAKFDTYDYAGAVEAWTQVYAKLGDSPTERQIRNDVIYNIATAQERAFDVDHDPAHLRQAVGLLRKYVSEYKALYEATPEGRAEVAAVEARIAELEAKIAAAESGAAPTTAAPATTPQPSPRAEAAAKKRALKDILRTDPDIAPRYRAGKAMVVGGAVTLSIGGVMLLGALSGIGTELQREGKTAMIVTGAVGGALAVSGAVLLGFGVPKRRRAIEDARSRVTVLPSAGPRGASLGVQLRF